MVHKNQQALQAAGGGMGTLSWITIYLEKLCKMASRQAVLMWRTQTAASNTDDISEL